jgi:isoleucyl-tRNA synthetase
VLVQLSKVLAPFTPFLADELYQKLTGGDSVHLVDWPQVGHVNELVVSEMETVRTYVNQGLSTRAKERIKVRQPLASVNVPMLGKFVDFADILREELNVKFVETGTEFAIDLEITPELKSEGIAREVIRHIQSARKEAGLNIDDRITLVLVTDSQELLRSITEHRKVISDETLATELVENGSKKFSTDVKIDGVNLTVSLEKS